MQLLASITGTQKISVPMTIVVSGIAKMFVGELVETGMHTVQFEFMLRSHFRDDSCSLLVSYRKRRTILFYNYIKI
jgi:hypothetical protein